MSILLGGKTHMLNNSKSIWVGQILCLSFFIGILKSSFNKILLTNDGQKVITFFILYFKIYYKYSDNESQNENRNKIP